MPEPSTRPRSRICYEGLRKAAQVLASAMFPVRCFGRHHIPAHGGALLASNHQSFLDPVLVAVGLHREVNFLARDSLFRYRLFRQLITSLNAFPVKRNTADLAAIKESLRRLKAGGLLAIFGEGTRTHDGTIAPIQSGTIMLARKTKVPVVPVVIDGAFESWPRTRKIFRPTTILVCYGQPMTSAQITELGDERAAQLLWQQQIRIQAELRCRYGKKPYSYRLVGDLP